MLNPSSNEQPAFVPDPAETFAEMVRRLMGVDLAQPTAPGITSLSAPPYPMPNAEIGRELERLYPEQVRVRYGAPMAYYWLDRSEPAELHLNYTEKGSATTFFQGSRDAEVAP